VGDLNNQRRLQWQSALGSELELGIDLLVGAGIEAVAPLLEEPKARYGREEEVGTSSLEELDPSSRKRQLEVVQPGVVLVACSLQIRCRSS